MSLLANDSSWRLSGLFCFLTYHTQKTHRLSCWEEAGPQKTGPGFHPLLRILRNLCGSAGRFCERFHIVKSLFKKSSAEPQRFCRTLGAKPSLSDPANSFPKVYPLRFVPSHGPCPRLLPWESKLSFFSSCAPSSLMMALTLALFKSQRKWREKPCWHTATIPLFGLKHIAMQLARCHWKHGGRFGATKDQHQKKRWQPPPPPPHKASHQACLTNPWLPYLYWLVRMSVGFSWI